MTGKMPLRIVCISDTHGHHDKLEIPDGDILIHAGDISGRGGRSEIDQFNEWIGRLPHKHKVVIAGNHDFALEKINSQTAKFMLSNTVYLRDSGVEIEGIRIWGSPWQPCFLGWAFNLPRGAALKEKWDLIPTGVDILVTHGPPQGILDLTSRGAREGCEELLLALERVRPKIHLFGHIHEARGAMNLNGTLCINASNAAPWYMTWHPPIVLRTDGKSVDIVGL